MTDTKLKIEIAVPNFFAIPTKKMEIESVPGTGRTYFLYRDEIVAVARRVEERANG
jgi:hypothetical protein